MLKKLQIKFVCAIMVITISMLCAIFAMVYHFTQSNLEEESIRTMQDIAANPFDIALLTETAGSVRLPCFSLLIEENGGLLAASSVYFDLSDEEFISEVVQAALASETQIGTLKQYSLRFYRVARLQGQCLVFVDISGEQNTLSQLIRSFLMIGIIAAALLFLISLLLARWAVKPVEEAWTQQRQFVADASHELKTPLTVILTNAELLQSPDYDALARAQFSDSILTMAKQMRGLVESLLQLARMDSHKQPIPMKRVDFSTLISDATLPFEPLYFEHDISMECQIREGVAVKGDESRLRQVIDILLDNAMKYTSVPATVVIRLETHGTHCLLSVANPGAAISPEDLKNIFKRFYRTDKARTGAGSYGLGLSIAESIVTEHRGKIWAESTGGVNTFFVRLPVES